MKVILQVLLLLYAGAANADCRSEAISSYKTMLSDINRGQSISKHFSKKYLTYYVDSIIEQSEWTAILHNSQTIKYYIRRLESVNPNKLEVLSCGKNKAQILSHMQKTSDFKYIIVNLIYELNSWVIDTMTISTMEYNKSLNQTGTENAPPG